MVTIGCNKKKTSKDPLSNHANASILIGQTPKDIKILNPVILDANTSIGTPVGVLSVDGQLPADDNYSFRLVEKDATDFDFFAITGNELILWQNLEGRTASLTFVVEVTNEKGLSLEKAFIFPMGGVDVKPSDIQLPLRVILENSEPESMIGNFIITDNAGDSHTLELIGPGDEDVFEIREGSSLYSKISFDYERKNSHLIRVRATDTTGLSFEKDIEVRVENINEAPTDIVLSVTDPDGHFLLGDEVMNLSVIDPDGSEQENDYEFELLSIDVLPNKLIDEVTKFLQFDLNGASSSLKALTDWSMAAFFINVKVLDGDTELQKTLLYEYNGDSLPQTCQNYKDMLAQGIDGTYWLYIDADINKPWQAYCHNMDLSPESYLTVIEGVEYNFSEYRNGVDAGSPSVKTQYSKIKIDPLTLNISGGHQEFSQTVKVGDIQHGESGSVLSMPYGVAMGCRAENTDDGMANIDLRGSSFKLEAPIVSGGFMAAFNAVEDPNYPGQVINFSGGGFCGWASVSSIFTPINTADHTFSLVYDSGLIPDSQ